MPSVVPSIFTNRRVAIRCLSAPRQDKVAAERSGSESDAGRRANCAFMVSVIGQEYFMAP